MKYALFAQSGWGHKGNPQLVGMTDMMNLIVAARHGKSRISNPIGWPKSTPRGDPGPAWAQEGYQGTIIAEGDLRELRRLAGKPDKRGGMLGRIPGIGPLLERGLRAMGDIPVLGKVLPYAGGPLAPLVGGASFFRNPRTYVKGATQLMGKFLGR